MMMIMIVMMNVNVDDGSYDVDDGDDGDDESIITILYDDVLC
jgi:hypothetical protein